MLQALYLLLLPQSQQYTREPDHPVYESTSCPTRLWQPSEIPVVYEINLAMDPADFNWLVANQALQCEPTGALVLPGALALSRTAHDTV